MIRNLLTTLGLRTKSQATMDRSAKSDAQKAVLIIDDNPDSLRTIRRALAGAAYRLETADTAESALGKLSSFRPDLVLVDSWVPSADGTRLASHLLADEELAAVRIVALTPMGTGSHGNPEAGGRFDGHIEKPIDPQSLPGQIHAFLESSAQSLPDRPVALFLPAAPTTDRRQQAARLLDAIEAGLPDSQFATGTRTGLHQLAAVVGGLQNYELAKYLQRAERLSNAATARARGRFRSVIRLCRELLESGSDVTPGLADLRAGYLEHRRTELDGLEHALKNGDFAALRKAGHNMKGTGAAYGFAELTDIGRAIERAAKENDAPALEVLLDQIESYLSIVRRSPEL